MNADRATGSSERESLESETHREQFGASQLRVLLACGTLHDLAVLLNSKLYKGFQKSQIHTIAEATVPTSGLRTTKPVSVNKQQANQ